MFYETLTNISLLKRKQFNKGIFQVPLMNCNQLIANVTNNLLAAINSGSMIVHVCSRGLHWCGVHKHNDTMLKCAHAMS